MRRWSVTLAVFFALGAALFPGAAPAQPHVLRWADGLDISTLNPLTPGAAPNGDLNVLTMAYLGLQDSRSWRPECALEAPTLRNGGISRDGLTLRYRMRPDARWSDGAPLTSADVAFTVDLVKDPKTNIIDRSLIVTYVRRVETPDAHTVVVRLTQPYGPLVAQLFTQLDVRILPKHLLAGVDVNTAPYMQLPVGAGPFRYTAWRRGERVELEPNPYFNLRRPKLQKIVYTMIPNDTSTINALRTGDIDLFPRMTFSDYEPIQNTPGLHAVTLAGVRPAWLTLNTEDPVLNDAAVRRALRVGLDRPSLLQRSYHGAAVKGELPLLPSDPNDAGIAPVPYDPARAGAMLDGAGWKRGPDGMRSKGGRPLTVQLAGGAGSSYVDSMLEQVRANWSALGVHIESKRYPLSLFFAPAAQGGIVFGGKFQVALFSVRPFFAWDLSGWSCSRVPPKGANYSRLCDPALDAIVERADALYDPAAAATFYHAAEKKLHTDASFILLARRNELYVYRDGVEGVHFDAVLPFGSIVDLDVTR